MLEASILLADGGYVCTNTIITPIRNPANNAERRFNRAHKHTRRLVESTIGELKNAYRCVSQLSINQL